MVSRHYFNVAPPKKLGKWSKLTESAYVFRLVQPPTRSTSFLQCESERWRRIRTIFLDIHGWVVSPRKLGFHDPICLVHIFRMGWWKTTNQFLSIPKSTIEPSKIPSRMDWNYQLGSCLDPYLFNQSHPNHEKRQNHVTESRHPLKMLAFFRCSHLVSGDITGR